MLLGYILLHDLLGGTLFLHSDWDSYTLQALSWREGRLDLGANYPWLELAIYEGKYYVSFPPVPSLFILPLTFIFGAATPNNFLMMLIAMGTSVTAYFIAKKAGMRRAASLICALFYVWGSNMLWMSTNGGVWFQAQGYNLLLLSLAALCALYEKRTLGYLFVSLAVGCRPFSALAFLPLFVYFAEKDMKSGKSFKESLKAQLPAFVLPVIVAAAYMCLNYLRFGDPLEFGHNYLPEFTSSEHGQFSLRYLPGNLKNLFLRPVTIKDGRLSFSFFDGFMFYIADPLFLLLFIQMIRRVFKKDKDEKALTELRYTRLSLLAAMLAMLIFTCMHKTLGGWQFGARYCVDMLPLALCYILSLGEWRPRDYEYVIMGFGIMFNFYGCMAIQLFT